MTEFEFSKRADFQRMVDLQAEEAINLEYKSSQALTRNSKDVIELCKDVSAMANSAGGQIIYGIREDNKTRMPAEVDEGVTDEKITREWLIQILNSHIQPRMDGVRIQRIALSEKGFGFIITVAPTITGPHQAPDKKYYKRFELQAVAMEDYEIRDVMRRSTTAILNVEVALAGGRKQAITLQPNQEMSEAFQILLSVSNLSSAPALYAVLTIGLDPQLAVAGTSNVEAVGRFADKDGTRLHWYQRRFAVPKDIPIFKECSIGLPDASFGVRVAPATFRQYTIRTIIETPGFAANSDWTLQQMTGSLEVYRESL